MLTRMYISDLDDKGEITFIRCRKCNKFFGKRGYAAHKRGCHVI